MSKPLMLIQAPVATRSGYGSHSRDLVRSLIKMDKFDIKIGSLKWGNCPMNALNDQDPNDKMIIDRLLTGPIWFSEFKPFPTFTDSAIFTNLFNKSS